MNPRILFITACLVWITPDLSAQEALLHYTQPAEIWEESLPVGNGRLGAMVFGKTGTERIALNEETLWTGGPYDPTVEGGAAALPEIQRLLFAGDVEKAHDLFGRTMMGKPYEQQKYQPLGTLLINFPGHETVQDYVRELDMDAGEVRVRYRVNGVTFTRTVFSSAPDQVIVIRLEADSPGAITFDARLFGIRNTQHSNYDTAYFQMDALAPDTLRLTGQNSAYLGIDGALNYEARMVAHTEGGSVRTDYRTLLVSGADAVTLVVAAATSFQDYAHTDGNPAARVAADLAAVADRDFGALRARHLEDHRALFRRVSLRIGDGSRAGIPTDQRLAEADSVADPGLAALAYQFGRYLLMGSSRPGTQAANLQGIWDESSNPSWDSKYTVNINLPMNYWLAESAGLPELSDPLFDLIRDVSVTGRSVAREHWGARGWVLHQNTDIWRAAAPMDGPSWGAWPVGGAWLTTHLVERDLYNPDPLFLQEWYPVLRDQALFLSDILVEHPDNGWLVTAPSNSPENFPAYPGNGTYFDEVSGLFLKGRMMQPGPTMDNHIVRAVFDGFLDWSQRTGQDAGLRAVIAAQRDRLPPNQIGKLGQLQEWITDWDELEPDHRHTSHLWGVYPGNEINPVDTPDMASAASATLARRSIGGCGWSYAHKAGAWARLHDGGEADRQLTAYLNGNVLSNLFSRCGRTLQVDGSLGMTGAIGEMLVQSDGEALELLPALPSSWESGSVQGIRARGGFSLDMTWVGGRVSTLTLHSSHGRPVAIQGADIVSITSGGQPVSFRTEGGLTRFETVAGSDYSITGR